MKKLDIRAFAIAFAILWSLAAFFVGIFNLIWPPYGAAFLEMLAAVYPGYKMQPGIWGLIVVTLYALLDGAVAGAIFAWLYNRFARD